MRRGEPAGGGAARGDELGRLRCVHGDQNGDAIDDGVAAVADGAGQVAGLEAQDAVAKGASELALQRGERCGEVWLCGI